jgi:NitT/TauT family transport system ATP-binding protein
MQSTMDIHGESISIEAVEKIFPTRDGNLIHALAETSLSIKPGEFVSVLGPSGCGKSTLLRLIAGLDQPTSGDVRLGSDIVVEPSDKIGIAFQQSVLMPWYTVEENIKLPAILQKRLTAAEIDTRCDELLEIVKLPGLGKKYPNELSGGMQQRVAIARSLITSPSVILMDEPFAALDAITREHMNDELLSVWAVTGATVFFITHDIAEAVYMSDRVIVMSPRPGRVVADISLDFPRPRGPLTRELPEFSHLLNEIRSLINH